MADHKANQAHFFFFCADLPPETLQVAEFSGSDRISEPYHFIITLISSRFDITPDEMLGKKASLYIHRDGEYYPYSGIIEHFLYVDSTTDSATYQCTLVPHLKLLALSRQTRVFQKMKVPDIITKVLDDAQLSEFCQQDIDSAKHPQHDFVVQYQESDLDFIRRLMEMEGIWFFFKEPPFLLDELDGSPGAEKCVISDKAAGFCPINGAAAVRFAAPSGMGEGIERPTKEVITRVSHAKSLIPAEAILKNYNYRTPETALSGTKAIASGNQGLNYEYGGWTKDTTQAQRAAEIMANRFATRQEQLTGSGSCGGFRAGHRFDLEEHRNPTFNTSYLLVGISHEGKQYSTSRTDIRFTYTNSFEALFGTKIQTYAPQLTTPTPSLPGIITATIEANDGQYASIDEMGRYKVRLPFDRSDVQNSAASKWVRLAQPYAGQSYGIHFPSHEGTEMVLACIDGDPSKIMGIGTVPNANTISPVTSSNKQQNLIRTAGQNQILMDDTDGKQKIILTTAAANTTRLDDENRAAAVQTTDGNGLLLDDKNQKCVWNSSTHSITMEYKSGSEAITIATGGGHVIKIDDTNKMIQIESAGGHMINMDDTGKKIELCDGSNKNKITLDGNSGMILDTKGTLQINAVQDITIKGKNITLEALQNLTAKATKDAAISGINVSVDATMDATISAMKNATISATVNATLKGTVAAAVEGAKTSISGTAMTTISGTMVKIN